MLFMKEAFSEGGISGLRQGGLTLIDLINVHTPCGCEHSWNKPDEKPPPFLSRPGSLLYKKKGPHILAFHFRLFSLSSLLRKFNVFFFLLSVWI